MEGQKKTYKINNEIEVQLTNKELEDLIEGLKEAAKSEKEKNRIEKFREEAEKAFHEAETYLRSLDINFKLVCRGVHDITWRVGLDLGVIQNRWVELTWVSGKGFCCSYFRESEFTSVGKTPNEALEEFAEVKLRKTKQEAQDIINERLALQHLSNKINPERSHEDI